MNLPLLTRYGDIVRYQHDRGSVAALDWRAYPGKRDFAEYRSAEQIGEAIGQAAVGYGPAAAYLAGYALALAARAWADRPAETQRAAIIQAGEWVRRARPWDARLLTIIEAAQARAQAAILAEANAETAIVDNIDREMNRADRIAERCGRIAAGLLDEHDQLLTPGFAGPAINWMLAAAPAQDGKQPSLTAIALPEQPDSARLAVDLASEMNLPATLSNGEQIELGFAAQSYSILLIGADRIALDGAVAAAPGSAAYATLARQHGIPCYVFAYSAPDPSSPTADALSARLTDHPASGAIIVPKLISAIITSRGIYRPEMIDRYLSDGEAPLDIIGLQPL